MRASVSEQWMPKREPVSARYSAASPTVTVRGVAWWIS